MTYSIGDIITTKKPHPCGCSKWEIIRTGADYKIKCTQCGHIVMLTSEALQKIIKNTGNK